MVVVKIYLCKFARHEKLAKLLAKNGLPYFPLYLYVTGQIRIFFLPNGGAQWGEVLSEGPFLITFDFTIHSKQTGFYRTFHESPNLQAVNILRFEDNIFLRRFYFSEDSPQKIQKQIVSSEK